MYLNLPNPTFLQVLIINPSIEFIGTLQKSRFWQVKVVIRMVYHGATVIPEYAIAFAKALFQLCRPSSLHQFYYASLHYTSRLYRLILLAMYDVRAQVCRVWGPLPQTLSPEARNIQSRSFFFGVSSWSRVSGFGGSQVSKRDLSSSGSRVFRASRFSRLGQFRFRVLALSAKP